jgi:hypothetical protein
MRRRMAKLVDVLQILSAGGKLQFTWANCDVRIIHVDGSSLVVDGRTYQAFIRGYSSRYIRHESGQAGDDLTQLVIEWSSDPVPTPL